MPSRLDQIIEDIQNELVRAFDRFPEFPTDPVHAAAIVAEEAGELVRASLQATYQQADWEWEEVKEEAVQTAAIALRFLVMMPYMKKRKSPQATDETAT